MSSESNINEKRQGWVYVLSNPSFSDLVKVGYTDKPVEQRMVELNSTGVPTPFEKEYEALVDGAKEVEQKAHSVLSESLHNKEFFKCTPLHAIESIREAVSLLGRDIYDEQSRIELPTHYTVVDSNKNNQPVNKITEIERYENGQKKSQFSIVDGKREGPLIEWYENGQKKSITPYISDNINGVKVTWSEKGKKKCEIQYENGQKHGIAKEFQENEKIACETPYLNDKKNGIERKFDENGKSFQETPYEDGVINGTQLEIINIDDSYSYSLVPYLNGEIHGIAESFKFDEVQREFIKTHSRPYVNGKKDGDHIYWYDGKVYSLEPYKNDLLHGEVIEGDYSKEPRFFKTKFKNGRPYGEAIERTESGVVTHKKIYNDDGSYLDIAYFDDGVNKLTETQYNPEGKIHGFEKYYLPDGETIYQTRYYNNGEFCSQGYSQYMKECEPDAWEKELEEIRANRPPSPTLSSELNKGIKKISKWITGSE